MSNRKSTSIVTSRQPVSEARALVAWCAENKLTISEGVRRLTSQSARENKNQLTPEQREKLEAAIAAHEQGDWDAVTILLGEAFPENAADFAKANEERKAREGDEPATSARQAAYRSGGV